MKLADQLGDVGQALIADHVGRLHPLPRRMSCYKTQDLAACCIDAEKARRTRPAALFEEFKQFVDERRVLRAGPAHRLTVANYIIHESASQPDLGHITNHGAGSLVRKAISSV